ncbi:MAG: RNA polymerase factor sigma-54 [Oscillochloris sp.]|nr:RNA polymerase factor sigma-54 [Oscillochloris sp.]
MDMRVTPALLNLAQLLMLPSMDLQQLVQQELAENPALEEIETYEQACARCGSLVIEGVCMHCANADTVGDGPVQREEQIDPLLFVAAPQSLPESLLSDLYVSLPTEDHPVALALVGNLDDRGFLADDLEVIADLLRIPLERVQRVLAHLREIGPPGIATRDTQECMLVQIDALEAQGVTNPHARTIIAEYFEDLGAGRFRQIGRRLRISADEMEEVRNFIRRHLWPFPAQAAMFEAAPLQRTRYRTADIAIVNREDTFVVEVLHSPRRILRLNPLYQDLARKAANLPDDEREHVREYIARARVFLSNLRQRESTLQRIGETIIERQDGFLRHGVRHLLPMTRAEIAAELGVHESTISRATADKTALLPNGTLLPMSEFFVVARGVQDVLRELIANEPRPLSDEELARLLGEQGHTIARRTVAKYRVLMKIPPSHLR